MHAYAAHRLVQHTLQVMWRWHGQMKVIFSWHVLLVAPIAVARKDLTPVTGTIDILSMQEP